MNIAEFETESAALDFMSFLMDHNNQGRKNVLFAWADRHDVEYTFNEHVIHESIFKDVKDYLTEHENS